MINLLEQCEFLPGMVWMHVVQPRVRDEDDLHALLEWDEQTLHFLMRTECLHREHLLDGYHVARVREGCATFEHDGCGRNGLPLESNLLGRLVRSRQLGGVERGSRGVEPACCRVERLVYHSTLFPIFTSRHGSSKSEMPYIVLEGAYF